MAAKKKSSAVELASQVDPRAPLDGSLLLSRAQALLVELEADLLARARASAPIREALRLRHEVERTARRTADPIEVWERHFVTQVAASWVLSCVFVRTLEDRGLLGRNRIAGPGAADSQRLFFEICPSLTEREYLLTVFRELARLPAARDLFDARHNPVWLLGPSAELAKKLLALFRAPSADSPGFRFGQTDTRFLGDLYQDLSADVRERFALLQTPHFVEKYILDRTLERAIARFGLEETTIIDPTCGSGHFLLGAFERLLDHRLRKEPGLDVREAARRALDAVYGADINPYAVAIARFRLTLSFLDKAGYLRLADAPAVPLHLVVADSLLHNSQQAQAKLGELAGQSMKAWGGEEFALEDEAAARDVLQRRFAAVVGNPPYITVKDTVLRERYREMYPRSAAGKYSVAAPFTERFFLLAKSGGFVGIITANSFMKREFGKKVIETFLPTVNLDGVVNTSGAYIPGHGTPTVLLFGTNEPKQGDDVLTVLAKRGEPSTPDDPEHGHVWRSIADHGEEVGFQNDYISVAHILRTTLEKHPWSLGGGGAAELKELLEERAPQRLKDIADSIGISSFTLEDEVYLRPRSAWHRAGVSDVRLRAMIIGEAIRDWSVGEVDDSFFPYDDRFEPIAPTETSLIALWPYRLNLSNNFLFGGKTKVQGGLRWYEFGRLTAEKLRTPFSIAFAFVATHNHFVLDRGGKVFNRTAPIIKLKEGATEEDHLALLAYLNSSTACFWMKQVFYPKGGHSEARPEKGIAEENRYEFAGTGMAELPVPLFPDPELVDVARELCALAKERTRLQPRAVVAAFDAVNSGELKTILEGTKRDEVSTFERMVAVQEDLDWLVYERFKLASQSAARRLGSNVRFGPGDRPFCSSRAPSPEAEDIWQARRAAIRSDPGLAFVEDPVFKRKWWGARGVFASKVSTYEETAVDACCEVIAARLEEGIARRPEPGPVAAFSQNVLERIAPFVAYLVESGATQTPSEIVLHDSVPFLAAYRHTSVGLEKRAEWERVWDLQHPNTIRKTSATRQRGDSAASSTSQKSASSATRAARPTRTRSRSTAGRVGTT